MQFITYQSTCDFCKAVIQRDEVAIHPNMRCVKPWQPAEQAKRLGDFQACATCFDVAMLAALNHGKTLKPLNPTND
jgi:hypothetical protein